MMTRVPDELRAVFGMLLNAKRALMPERVKRLLRALFSALVIAALGPPVWIAIVVLGHLRSGDALRVFHDRMIWEEEVAAKWLYAVAIAGAVGVGVFLEILHPTPRSESRSEQTETRTKSDHS
jgi:hypothetical protein